MPPQLPHPQPLPLLWRAFNKVASEIRAAEMALTPGGRGAGSECEECFNSSKDFTFQCLGGRQGECFFLLKLIPHLLPRCFEVQLHDLLDVVSYSDFQVFQLGRWELKVRSTPPVESACSALGLCSELTAHSSCNTLSSYFLGAEHCARLWGYTATWPGTCPQSPHSQVFPWKMPWPKCSPEGVSCKIKSLLKPA